MSARQRHRLRLKSFIFFFSRSEIFERTFGLAHWHIVSNRLCLSALWRRKKKNKNDDMESHYYLLRECMSSHDDCLSRHRASVRRCVILFFWMCDDATPFRFPESRVKRCQIKYKMRCSPFAFTDAREKIWDAHFLIVLCAHTYFFDVHVLLWVRVLCMRCEESTHEFGIESPPYKKRWKYPRISAFLRRLFRKLKDVFFF